MCFRAKLLVCYTSISPLPNHTQMIVVLQKMKSFLAEYSVSNVLRTFHDIHYFHKELFGKKEVKGVKNNICI